MQENDTIGAIATAPGEAGIAVIRISGVRAMDIADHIFRGTGQRPSVHKSAALLHGYIHDEAGDLDEVLLLIMPAPHSYTTENTVEIQCHGGSVSARRILRQVLAAGARLAEPGEFTRRAFLNGRIDLVQAEAVLDLIRARSDRAASAALEQLEGRLSERFDEIYAGLIDVISELEASLDFPEDELPVNTIPKISRRLEGIVKQSEALLATWDEGLLLHEGALVVIIGKTNAGKSTLLNFLLGTDRAIVSPEHGTTRDFIEESLVLNHVPLRLVDTAGIRETNDPVEQEGIRRTMELVKRADLNILVLDASQALSNMEKLFIERLNHEKCLIIMNKTDLGIKMSAKSLPKTKIIRTSLLHNVDREHITNAIHEFFCSGMDFSVPPHAVISERQRQLLIMAMSDQKESLNLLEQNREDLTVPVVSLLRHAAESLGLITGKEYQNELLDAIFHRFCIGK